MPCNRTHRFLRSIADYRVEACFLAALVFTLGHNAFHNGQVELHTTMTHDPVVHEVIPARVAVARSAAHARHPAIVGIAVPAPRPAAIGAGIDRRIVIKRGSDSAAPCEGSSALTAGAVGEGATCKLIRVVPAAPGISVPKTLADGN